MRCEHVRDDAVGLRPVGDALDVGGEARIGAERGVAEDVTPFNNALQMPNVSTLLSTTTEAGRAMLDTIVTQQANLIAYLNDFKLLMYLTLLVIPLIFIIATPKSPAAADGHDEPVVME